MPNEGGALSLARRAVNSWACFATRKIEHDAITALHREIDEMAGAHPDADSAEILSSERSTSSGPRDKASSSSDGRAAALDAAPSETPAVCTPELNAQIEAQIDHDKALFEAGYVHGQQCAADGGAVSRP